MPIHNLLSVHNLFFLYPQFSESVYTFCGHSTICVYISAILGRKRLSNTQNFRQRRLKNPFENIYTEVQKSKKKSRLRRARQSIFTLLDHQDFRAKSKHFPLLLHQKPKKIHACSAKQRNSTLLDGQESGNLTHLRCAKSNRFTLATMQKIQYFFYRARRRRD